MRVVLDRIEKRFGAQRAVDGLSLTIEAGEIFGLLGPNGAGKTTTVSMLIGLLAPDAGRVELEGLGPPTSPQARRGVGVAPQSLAIYDALTARENLRFFGRLYGLGGAALARRVEELLELVGLSERARSRAGTFSGGMKRRLNLAAGLVHEPRLLLLDEPTAGVDPQSRSAIFDIVLRLRAEGATIVYTTHYMEEAQRLADRVAIIDRGRLLALGAVDQLIEDHGGGSVLVAQSSAGEERLVTADPVADLRRVLEREGVSGVRIERPSLESVFLGLTGRSLRE
jgi:ABC-2 type transport system ATP-binding protein